MLRRKALNRKSGPSLVEYFHLFLLPSPPLQEGRKTEVREEYFKEETLLSVLPGWNIYPAVSSALYTLCDSTFTLYCDFS